MARCLVGRKSVTSYASRTRLLAVPASPEIYGIHPVVDPTCCGESRGSRKGEAPRGPSFGVGTWARRRLLPGRRPPPRTHAGGSSSAALWHARLLLVVADARARARASVIRDLAAEIPFDGQACDREVPTSSASGCLTLRDHARMPALAACVQLGAGEVEATRAEVARRGMLPWVSGDDELAAVAADEEPRRLRQPWAVAARDGAGALEARGLQARVHDRRVDLVEQGATDRLADRSGADLILYGEDTITYDVHRYTDSTNNSFVFCEDCFANRGPLSRGLRESLRHAINAQKNTLASGAAGHPLSICGAADEAAPPLAELERFAKEAGLNFSESWGRKRSKLYIGYHGNRRIAFPCVTPDKMLDSVRYSRWRDAFQKCMWFMPAFITNGELEKGCSDCWTIALMLKKRSGLTG